MLYLNAIGLIIKVLIMCFRQLADRSFGRVNKFTLRSLA